MNKETSRLASLLCLRISLTWSTVELPFAILMMATRAGTWFSFVDGNLWLISDIIRQRSLFPIAILWKTKRSTRHKTRCPKRVLHSRLGSTVLIEENSNMPTDYVVRRRV